MEFIDYEKLYKQNFKQFVKPHHLVALEEDLTSTEISVYEHEMNNSFIDCSFGKTIDNIEFSGYNFIGIGKAPYPHHDWYWAIVIEDKKTFDKFWCHLPDYLAQDWREEKGKYAIAIL